MCPDAAPLAEIVKVYFIKFLLPNTCYAADALSRLLIIMVTKERSRRALGGLTFRLLSPASLSFLLFLHTSMRIFASFPVPGF